MIHGLASFLLLLIVSTQAHAANEINILTPEDGTRINDQTVWLVASTTVDMSGMVARLKNKQTTKKIAGEVFKKDKVVAFHALLSLEAGLNEVTIGEKSLSIFYRPSNLPTEKSTRKREVLQVYPPYFFHNPQKEATCAQCHDSVKAESKPDCLQCHGELTSEKYLHGPLGGGACVVCHDPESAPTKFSPRFGGKGELCFSCHKEKNVKQLSLRYFHGPVGVEECTACHDPHGSPFRFQLVEEEKCLCYICHDQKRITNGKIVHGAIQQPKGCCGCHDSHASDCEAHVLDFGNALCSKAECHPRFAEITEDHPVLGHPVTGKFGPERSLSCSSCHDPHSSDFRFLLPAERHSFCSKCHDDERS